MSSTVTHPQVRVLTLPLLKRLQPLVLVVFDDIQPEVANGRPR